MHDHGEAVTQNLVEAVKWYRLSAEQGYAEALYALGLAHYTGAGAPKDHIRALMWMELAASQGDENALQTRDLIAKKMTPDDISEARRLAREWSETHGGS